MFLPRLIPYFIANIFLLKITFTTNDLLPMYKNNIIALFFILSSALLWGQNPRTLPDLNEIWNTSWTLIKASNQPILQREMTVKFDNKEMRITGDGGCNSFSVAIKNIVSKKNYIRIKTDSDWVSDNHCTQTVNKVEHNFINNLKFNTLNLSLEEDQLIVTTNHKTKLTFAKQSLNPLVKYIEKHNWKLIQLNGKSDRVYHQYLSFDFSENKLKGKSGTDMFEAYFSTNQKMDSIHIHQLNYTKSGHLKKERQKMQDNFLEALQNGRFGFDVAEQTLNFYKDNKIVMMFGIIPKTP